MINSSWADSVNSQIIKIFKKNVNFDFDLPNTDSFSFFSFSFPKFGNSFTCLKQKMLNFQNKKNYPLVIKFSSPDSLESRFLARTDKIINVKCRNNKMPNLGIFWNSVITSVINLCMLYKEKDDMSFYAICLVWIFKPLQFLNFKRVFIQENIDKINETYCIFYIWSPESCF